MAGTGGSVWSRQAFERCFAEWERLYWWQQSYVPVFREWVLRRGRRTKSLPVFLPIEVFRYRVVLGEGLVPRSVFRSSGTTGRPPARHFRAFPELYRESVWRGFTWWSQTVMGWSSDRWWHISLFPAPAIRQHSSLNTMIAWLMEKTLSDATQQLVLPRGTWIAPELSKDVARLYTALMEAIAVIPGGYRPLVWGPPFVFIALAERGKSLPSETCIIETGGMKGRGPEPDRRTLHRWLARRLGCSVHSEFGMCELSVQAYTVEAGVFAFPPWVHIQVEDPQVPGKLAGHRMRRHVRPGRLCLIDPYNFETCAFLATEDLVQPLNATCFQVIGRLETCDLRGCHLLWTEAH